MCWQRTRSRRLTAAVQPTRRSLCSLSTKPKEPDTFVISMVGDCTLASIQTGRDFDSYIDKNGTSWPFSGVLEYLSKDEFTLANLECAFSDEALKSSSLFYFRGPSSICGHSRAGQRRVRHARQQPHGRLRRQRRRGHEGRFGCGGGVRGQPPANPRCSRPSTA
ncbi:MAG: hypothetical protein ACLUNO_02520 [Oscillospiraceae bacterium]